MSFTTACCPHTKEHTRPVSTLIDSPPLPLPCISVSGWQPPVIVTLRMPCFESGNSLLSSSGTVCVSETFST